MADYHRMCRCIHLCIDCQLIFLVLQFLLILKLLQSVLTIWNIKGFATRDSRIGIKIVPHTSSRGPIHIGFTVVIRARKIQEQLTSF